MKSGRDKKHHFKNSIQLQSSSVFDSFKDILLLLSVLADFFMLKQVTQTLNSEMKVGMV